MAAIKRLLRDLSDEFLKCSNCSNMFDEGMHVPRYYPCLHLTCHECMARQFRRVSADKNILICPLCNRFSDASSADLCNYDKVNILRQLENFISTKEKDLCDTCSDNLSDTFCSDCNSSQCISCSEAIHVGDNSNHNIKFGINDQGISIGICHMCEKGSDIYCSKCKLFFCYPCGDVHHNDKSVGTHEVYKVNDDDTSILETAPAATENTTGTVRTPVMTKLLSDLSGEFLECFVCLNPFDEDTHVPRYYPCSHWTCQDCMSKQLVSISPRKFIIRCPLCVREYIASTQDASTFERVDILRKLKTFISTKNRVEFCDRCIDNMSDAFCTNCNLSLCMICSKTIHNGVKSNHNIKTGIKKQNIPLDACQVCLEKSDMYCPKCKFFLCNTCKDIQHRDESAGSHRCVKFDEFDTGVVPEVATMDNTDAGDIPMNVEVRPMRKYGVYAVSSMVFVSLVMTFVLSIYIPRVPAYIILPLGEVEQVNMICRRKTREEVYQNRAISKVNVHRTLCTFNIFHYELRNRNKTYFAVDIDIDTANAYRVGNVGKLFTIKLFHQHKQHDTHRKQGNTYLSVSWCNNFLNKLALCMDEYRYKSETPETQKVISIARLGQQKRVSFLFVVDNIRKIMDIFSPTALWKDAVFLEDYYEQRTLNVWISLADSKNDKHISARIRSGTDITIGDLPIQQLFQTTRFLKMW